MASTNKQGYQQLLDEGTSVATTYGTQAVAGAVTTAATKQAQGAASHVVVFQDPPGADGTEKSDSVTDDDDGFTIPGLPCLQMTSKVIVAWFSGSAVAAAPLTVFSIIAGIPFSLVLGALIIANGIIAAYATIRWGTIGEKIKQFKAEVDKQEVEVQYLHESVERTKSATEAIQRSTEALENEEKELEAHISEFDEIRDALQQVCGENEEIADLLDSNCRMFDEMTELMNRVERASMMSTFYDAIYGRRGDGDDMMDPKEWKRFLGRLTKKQQRIIEELGDFEDLADAEDGDHRSMTMRAFETDIIPRVLEKMDLSQAFEDIAP